MQGCRFVIGGWECELNRETILFRVVRAHAQPVCVVRATYNDWDPKCFFDKKNENLQFEKKPITQTLLVQDSLSLGTKML